MNKLTKQLKQEKAKLLYADLQKAIQRLKEISAARFTITNRDATIKRFEFTFEIAWKLIKTLVELTGLKSASPRSAIRQAADTGLLNDPEKWLKFLNIRNTTVHIYKEEMIKMVYPEAKKFHILVAKLLETAKTHLV